MTQTTLNNYTSFAEQLKARIRMAKVIDKTVDIAGENYTLRDPNASEIIEMIDTLLNEKRAKAQKGNND